MINVLYLCTSAHNESYFSNEKSILKDLHMNLHHYHVILRGIHVLLFHESLSSLWFPTLVCPQCCLSSCWFKMTDAAVL